MDILTGPPRKQTVARGILPAPRLFFRVHQLVKETNKPLRMAGSLDPSCKFRQKEKHSRRKQCNRGRLQRTKTDRTLNLKRVSLLP